MTTPESPPTLEYARPGLSRPPIGRFLVWVLLCVVIVLVTLIWISSSRDATAFFGSRFIWAFVSGWLQLGSLIVAAAILLRTTPTEAIRLSRDASTAIVLLIALGFQVMAVWGLLPGLSDDATRYHTEGRMWREGHSPYAKSPEDFRLQPGRPYDVIEWSVAHAVHPSIYPPVAQLTFAICTSGELPLPRHWTRSAEEEALNSHLMRFRVMYAASAVVATILLIVILHHLDQSVWWVILFAWNPLVIIDTGAMPHVDIVGIVFLLLTILMLLKNRPLLAGLMLAFACGAKPQAAILLPWLLRDIATSNPLHARRHIARSLGGFAVACAVIYLPALAYQHGYRGFFSTLSEYSSRWEFNGSIYELIKSAFGEGDAGRAAERAKSAARMLALSAAVFTALLLWKSRATFIEAGYWLFLIGLLFSPVVYPWYLLWMLCFIPLIRGRQGLAGLVWCETVGLSYVVWNLPEWKLPASYTLLQYVPVYALLILELYFCTRNGLRRPAMSAGGAAIFQ